MLKAKRSFRKVVRSNPNLQRFVNLGGKVWGLSLVGIIASALQGLANLGFPLLTKVLVDQVLPSKRVEFLLIICVGFLVVAACIVGLEFLGSYMGAAASEKVTLFLREEIATHALQLGIDERGLAASSNAAPLIAVDAPMVGSVFGKVFQQGVFQVIRFVGAVLLIAVINWRLLLVAPIMIMMLTAGPVLMRRRLVDASRNHQEAEAAVLTTASEFLTDLLGLRAAFAIPWAEGILRTRFRTRRSTQLQQERLAIVSKIGYLALWIVYSGTYFFAGLLAFQGRLSFGDVLALGQLMATLAFPSQSLGSVYSSYTTALASLQRIDEFLAQEVVELFHKTCGTKVSMTESREDDQPSSVLPLICHNIKLLVGNRVPVLRDVNITIESSDWVAVAGASGAGKSTLAQVLAGLRVPTSGHVMAGGRLLSDWDEEVFRTRVGFVNGDANLYRGSLFDNVSLGRVGVSPEIVYLLLEMVGAMNIVNRLDGLYSLQVEGKKKLSSGERQRIGLARGLAASPDLLILDEATSALDSQSEVTLFQNLRKKFPRLTVILISHRLSTILECDKIVVLDRGSVSQQESPSALLSKKGPFRELVQSQVVDDHRP
jgi:ABC-type bacteriocin/lantibiotic exporter with double-glycine peptidase domain